MVGRKCIPNTSFVCGTRVVWCSVELGVVGLLASYSDSNLWLRMCQRQIRLMPIFRSCSLVPRCTFFPYEVSGVLEEGYGWWEASNRNYLTLGVLVISLFPYGVWVPEPCVFTRTQILVLRWWDTWQEALYDDEIPDIVCSGWCWTQHSFRGDSLSSYSHPL